jgi:hypothetical protein
MNIGVKAIGVDSAGEMHLVYFRPTGHATGQLEQAQEFGGHGGWFFEPIDTVVLGWTSPTMRIDASDVVHVGYVDLLGSSSVKYARRGAAGGWTTEVVDTGVAISTASLDVDTLGGVHMSYSTQTGDELRYAHRAPAGGWTNEVVQTCPTKPHTGLGDSLPSSIEVGNLGFVHITFMGPTAKCSGLQYARRDPAGGWTIKQIDSLGNDVTRLGMGRDPGGDLHVSYMAGVNHSDLRYATTRPEELHFVHPIFVPNCPVSICMRVRINWPGPPPEPPAPESLKGRLMHYSVNAVEQPPVEFGPGHVTGDGKIDVPYPFVAGDSVSVWSSHTNADGVDVADDNAVSATYTP